MFESIERFPLEGSEPALPSGNSVEHSETEPIVVTLFLRSKEILPTPSGSIPHLSRIELLERHGPNESDFYLALAFAKHFGLVIHSSSLDQRIVRITGSARDMQHAFGVDFRFEERSGKICRLRNGPILLPNELAGIVTAVFGLDTHSVARPHFRVRAGAKQLFGRPDGAFDGIQLASIYNFPASTGQNQTIALIELGGGFNQFDLDTFFASLNLTPPSVKAVSVLGGVNAPVIDRDADTEVALDIEVAGAVASGSNIVVFFAPNTEQGFFEAVSAAIHTTVNQPDIISISWGAAEAQWSGQMLTSMSQLFQSAAALGISVFVAAGDDGANDNVNDGQAHVDFPASSPWATGCGGTTLTVTNGVRTEITWNSSSEGGGATGGGISNVFPPPTYQQALNMPVNLNGGTPGRGVPDVSAVADPFTPYACFVDGSWTAVGGTSAVAPLFAGLMARMNSVSSKRIGFLNTRIYAATADTGFNDITSGDNSADGINGYSAGIGWDAVTGWGSPDGEQLFQVLTQPAKEDETSSN